MRGKAVWLSKVRCVQPFRAVLSIFGIFSMPSWCLVSVFVGMSLSLGRVSVQSHVRCVADASGQITIDTLGFR